MRLMDTVKILLVVPLCLCGCEEQPSGCSNTRDGGQRGPSHTSEKARHSDDLEERLDALEREIVDSSDASKTKSEGTKDNFPPASARPNGGK